MTLLSTIVFFISFGLACVNPSSSLQGLSGVSGPQDSGKSLSYYCDLDTEKQSNYYVNCEVIVGHKNEKYTSYKKQHFLRDFKANYCNDLNRLRPVQVNCVPDPSEGSCSKEIVCTLEVNPHTCRFSKEYIAKWNFPETEFQGSNRCVAYENLASHLCRPTAAEQNVHYHSAQVGQACHGQCPGILYGQGCWRNI